ncbi:hypothetical protein CDCA_CDCA03G0931 [Cyanidium caldarium]|uniref:Photolyase/cryptochrome alpha/beta domain-containing protein n=1 Tax=Cyanidium caldarium TaxID=2771 RepID=A0AAV9IRU5_CYACA|nr:hypothetical protein CDCA_CDCA03G0931 [Cyanidium caldarium]
MNCGATHDIVSDTLQLAWVMWVPTAVWAGRCSSGSTASVKQNAQLTRRRRPMRLVKPPLDLTAGTMLAQTNFFTERATIGCSAAPAGTQLIGAGLTGHARSAAGGVERVAVLWLRVGENLRLDDNPTLLAAIDALKTTNGGQRKSRPLDNVALLPVFVATRWGTDGRPWSLEDAQHLRQTLNALRSGLDEAGSGLVILEADASVDDDASLMAAAVGRTFAALLQALDMRHVRGVFYPCGVTQMQRAEEEAVRQAIADLNQRRATAEPDTTGPAHVECHGLLDAGSTLHSIAALPFPVTAVPDDCDAFGAALTQHAVVADAAVDRLAQLPPLPQSCGSMRSTAVHIPPLNWLSGPCDGEERAHWRSPSTLTDGFDGEAGAAQCLRGFATGTSPLARIAHDEVVSELGGVLCRALHIGCLSPRRVWQEVCQHTTANSLRRHSAWCELLLRDFCRLLTLKRGVHPA